MSMRNYVGIAYYNLRFVSTSVADWSRTWTSSQAREWSAVTSCTPGTGRLISMSPHHFPSSMHIHDEVD